jgi:hypothetical protein
MAEAPDPVKSGQLDFLKRKVGPLPIAVWIIIGVVVWWYVSNRSGGGTAGSAAGSAAANQETDPAGNVGTIDPATGYVYGTPEDLASLASNNSTGTAPQTAPSTTYTTNAQWQAAAIAYLVQNGVNTNEATQATVQYLAGQVPTSTQEGYINEAIQGIGPAPTTPVTQQNPNPPAGPGKVKVPDVVGKTQAQAVPIIDAAGLHAHGPSPAPKATQVVSETHPASTDPPVDKGSTVDLVFIDVPDKTTGKSTSAPTGLRISGQSNHSLEATWNKVSGATGYDVSVNPGGKTASATAADPHATVTGLTGGTRYTVQVSSKPGGKGHATASVTLPK